MKVRMITMFPGNRAVPNRYPEVQAYPCNDDLTRLYEPLAVQTVGQNAPEQTQTQHGNRRAGSDQAQELAGTGELIYKVAPGDVLHVLGAGDEKETKPHAPKVGDS